MRKQYFSAIANEGATTERLFPCTVFSILSREAPRMMKPTNIYDKQPTGFHGLPLRAVGFLTALLLPFLLSAQLSYDTTYRTSYYEQKVTLFRLLPDSKGEIIFLGNSITDMGEWTEIWQNANVKNRGISGDNTFGVLARLDEIVSSKPLKVFILIGINDIAKNTPDSVILVNYGKIVDRIQTASPQTQIFVQSVLPTNNEFTEFMRHQNKGEHIRLGNEALKKMAAAKRVFYVDLYSGFLNEGGQLDKRYTNDGLHLAGEGYIHWKRILQAKGYMK